MLHTCPLLPLRPDSSTMPMKSKLAALNLFCKAMLYTGKRTSDPDANLYLSDEARGLARRENCMLAPTLRLAARSYNWIRLLSQSAQPNLPLLAEAEMASRLSPTEPPPHLKHYEAERSSLTLQMILETVHIYTEEETMEPDDFKLAALIISQTLYNLGMGGQTVRDIVNGAAQHLRWILPSDSTRVLNGIHLCLFPSDISPWPREADTNPHTQSDEHALGILDAEIHMLQRASKIYRRLHGRPSKRSTSARRSLPQRTLGRPATGSSHGTSFICGALDGTP